MSSLLKKKRGLKVEARSQLLHCIDAQSRKKYHVYVAHLLILGCFFDAWFCMYFHPTVDVRVALANVV